MRAKSADSAFQLDGKIALVTGAGRGIGRAVALALAAAGAEPVLVSRTQGELDEVAAEIVSGAVMPGRCGSMSPAQMRSVTPLPASAGSISSSTTPGSTGRNPFSRSTSRPSICYSGSTSEPRLSSPRPPHG